MCIRDRRDGMTAYKASVIRSQRIHETIGKTRDREKSHNFREIVQTFNSIFHEYLKHRQIKSIDQDTYRYQKHIQSHFGDRTPESIKFDVYKEFRERISEDRKPSTVRNILELMRRISNFGVKYQTTNGLSFPIEMPTLNNQKTETLTEEEIK